MRPVVHASSVIHDGARVGEGVEIGPFCEIGPNVILGEGVKLHSRVTLTGHVELGENVEVFTGASLGHRAQVIGSKDVPGTGVIVGPRTVIRENVTIHAGMPTARGMTRVGSDCYIMAYAHFGHDCQIGDHNVIANCVQFAGHITTGKHVWAGGLVAVHQFTEVGEHAFIAGGAIVVGDIIPFGMVSGNRATLQGLNVKGLSRRGFSRADVLELRRVYKSVFEGDGAFSERVTAAREACAANSHAAEMLDFIEKDRPRPLCLPERT